MSDPVIDQENPSQATPTPTTAPAPAPTTAPAPTAGKGVTASPVAPAKPMSDWVQVRLSASGIAMAATGGVVHVANARMAYKFVGTAPQRVLRVAEWTRVLSIDTFNGQPIFELVPDAAAAN